MNIQNKPAIDKKIKGTLLVLGNGFDINCGLKSKFSDFFESKIAEIAHAADTRFNSVSSNIWYLLLYFAFYDDNYYDSQSNKMAETMSNSNPLWMDVESFIKKIITINKKDDAWMNSYFPAKCQNYPEYLTHLYNSRMDTYVIGQHNQKSAVMKHFTKLKKLDFNIYSYLYDELLKFENEFKNYIYECVQKTPNYTDYCEQLYKQLIDFLREPTSVISFNYTNSLRWFIDSTQKEFEKNYYNVHGSLETDIIIGFDSGDFTDNENLGIKMSKAWQKMNLIEKPYELPKKDTLNTIKFYGHSLGPQDYSYFHSLFDYYDIYNSSITLVFYYTEYKYTEEENALIRGQYVSAVYKLLTDYAKKSGNEEKVTTIISRLQLENRLKIKKISCIT